MTIEAQSSVLDACVLTGRGILRAIDRLTALLFAPFWSSECVCNKGHTHPLEVIQRVDCRQLPRHDWLRRDQTPRSPQPLGGLGDPGDSACLSVCRCTSTGNPLRSVRGPAPSTPLCRGFPLTRPSGSPAARLCLLRGSQRLSEDFTRCGVSLCD